MKLHLAVAMLCVMSLFGNMALAEDAKEAAKWYNFKTKKYESLTRTPDAKKMKELIPQNPEAQVLFDRCMQIATGPAWEDPLVCGMVVIKLEAEAQERSRIKDTI